jgi:spore coat protein U-like protein
MRASRAICVTATLLAALPAPGAGTHAAAVSATILSKSNCAFDTAGPSNLAFGTIDPSSAAAVTASVGIVFRCGGSAANATYVITSDDGLHEAGPSSPRLRHATLATEYLPYTLNLPASATVPKNVDTTFTLVGTIQPSAFANARAGAYADTVILTIAP